jgi:hypothetical protein
MADLKSNQRVYGYRSISATTEYEAYITGSAPDARIKGRLRLVAAEDVLHVAFTLVTRLL